MPVSWQTRLFCSSATADVGGDRLQDLAADRVRLAVASRPASASRRSWGMSFSDQTYRCAPASSTVLIRSVSTVVLELSPFSAPLCRRAPRPPAEHGAVEQGVAHHPVAAVHPAGDLPGGVQALHGGLPVVPITSPPFW